MSYDRLMLLNPNDKDSVKVSCVDKEERDRTFVLITEPSGTFILIDKINQPMRDYINQLRKLRDELGRFISYLEHER